MIPIIDCRSLEDYKQGHIKGAAHIALASLEDSWHELPAKGAILSLCGYKQDIDRLENIFTAQQYKIDRMIPAEQILDAGFELEQGAQSTRLWKGNPLLENHFNLISGNIDQKHPVALDIGCGSGRDTMLLAQQGFKVVAIDNKNYALEKLAKFAAKLDLQVSPQNLDCEKHPQQLIELIQNKQPRLIMQSRYLHRPLLDVYKEHLPQGAIVAIHTFLEACAKFGSPKNPAYLLKNRELATKYADWNILLDDRHLLEDGRPLSLFLAQKP